MMITSLSAIPEHSTYDYRIVPQWTHQCRKIYEEDIWCHMAIYIQTKYNAEWKDQRERLESEELNNVEKANGQQNG